MAKQFQSVADLSGQPKQITELFESESDRGAILIMAAYLEEILGNLIAESCVSEDAANDILEFRGPAGGFDLKVRLCFALGIIHKQERDGLEAIRKIRNSAAHFDRKSGFNVLFDTEKTQQLVENLAASQNLKLKPKTSKDARSVFFISVRLLATKLYARGIEIVTPQAPKTLKEKANEYREALKGTEKGKELAAVEAEMSKGNFEPFLKGMEEMKRLISEKLKKHE